MHCKGFKDNKFNHIQPQILAVHHVHGDFKANKRSSADNESPNWTLNSQTLVKPQTKGGRWPGKELSNEKVQLDRSVLNKQQKKKVDILVIAWHLDIIGIQEIIMQKNVN